MSIITKYICDKCGASQDTSEQMWHLRLFVDYNDAQRHYLYEQGKHNALWCRPCVEHASLLPSKREDLPATPPTLEDLIADIVTNVLDNR